MSLPVCPSAFIRFAVVMCSASSTLRGSPELGAVDTRCGSLQSCSLLHEFTLVLGEGPQNADHHAPGGGRGVNPIARRNQRHSAFGQSLDGLQDVQHVAPGPVELPHHHGVAGTELIHQGGKAGRSSLAPDMVSEKIFDTPAAFSASCCWWSV